MPAAVTEVGCLAHARRKFFDLHAAHKSQIAGFALEQFSRVYQPILDVVRRLALALSVSADVLVFEKTERDPSEDLRLQFEAIDQLPPEEQAVVKEGLESLIIKYQTRRWDVSRATAKAAVATTSKATPPTTKTPTKRAAHTAR